MKAIPIYVHVLFSATTLLSVFFTFKAAKNSKITAIVCCVWLLIQSVLALTGFYTDTQSMPPRFAFMVAPPMIGIVLLFATSTGRRYIDNLDLGILTLLQAVRIPVEIGLFLLFQYKVVPELMTFKGLNFDILTGITALVVWFVVFKLRTTRFSNVILAVWNIAGLFLLFNIVYHAIFSVETPFQKFAFDMPNRGVLYFPFNWLPCFIVPLALFAHLASLRKIFSGEFRKSIAPLELGT